MPSELTERQARFQAQMRADGMCGDLINNGKDFCCREAGHDPVVYQGIAARHMQEREPQTDEEYRAAIRVFNNFPDDAPRWQIRQAIHAVLYEMRKNG